MNARPLQALLVDAGQAGTFYLTASDLDGLRAAAGELGLRCIDIDLAGCTDKPALMQGFADAFAFPPHFGHNWDALADCLADLDWLPAEGYVLTLENPGPLRDAEPDDYAILVSVLEGACDAWRDHGRPFWAFLALPDDQFDALQA
jgi:RNAse (barnase) inhibitor barstar